MKGGRLTCYRCDVSCTINAASTTERDVVDLTVMPTQPTTEWKDMLIFGMRFREQVESEIRTCSSEPLDECEWNNFLN
jgi:hypothetical protein